MKNAIWRAIIEISFVIFLFYSNLLMGEYNGSGMGQKMGFAWAIKDIFTTVNFIIAMVAGLVGYAVVEIFLQRNYREKITRSDTAMMQPLF